jgi:hypothetical protein
MVDLAEAAAQLDAVEVVASGEISVFSPDKMGAGTNVSQAQIRALRRLAATFRTTSALIRVCRKPTSSAVKSRWVVRTPASTPSRSDGVSTNDPFGLESNNLPTLRQPVSIDAIEEVQIAIAEYDTHPDRCDRRHHQRRHQVGHQRVWWFGLLRVPRQ